MKKRKLNWEKEFEEDIYEENFREQMVEDDSITDAEEGFMLGYEEEEE
ncbi:hypothetical protein J4405_00370 [Candidatus Woesearchaeota archaeon]|nr:hypothetical protein [Candidatus Woesearchaeota archaeon]